VQDLQRYVDQAMGSLYFSGARIDDHLEAFLRDQSDACISIGRELAGTVAQIYLVGSGGSFATMQTARYALDGILLIPTEVVPSYELIWRGAARLGPDAVAVLASYSGETEDTVAALRHAKSAGARTIAIVARPESTMARDADIVIPYDSGAIYEVPVCALVRIAVGLTEGTPAATRAAELSAAVDRLPAACRRTLDVEAPRAEGRARELLRDQHLYVLGSGPYSPLAYKLAMSVIMENVRIGATFSDACEWRHGPAEALERVRGSFIVLAGTDASRDMTMRAVDFCRANGSRVMLYDAAEFGEDVDPLLGPVVMNSHTQWLIVYSAILRGITDLDERVFMGHSVLATGGATWP
jgi:fructoselysine 6-phosphate deglycase